MSGKVEASRARTALAPLTRAASSKDGRQKNQRQPRSAQHECDSCSGVEGKGKGTQELDQMTRFGIGERDPAHGPNERGNGGGEQKKRAEQGLGRQGASVKSDGQGCSEGQRKGRCRRGDEEGVLEGGKDLGPQQLRGSGENPGAATGGNQKNGEQCEGEKQSGQQASECPPWLFEDLDAHCEKARLMLPFSSEPC
jgi:hypothetical protein